MKRTMSALILALFCVTAWAESYVREAARDHVFVVVLADATDGFTPETEKKATDTTVTYCCVTDGNSLSSYDDTGMWTEIGDGKGNYRLIMGASEFADADKEYFVDVVVSGCRERRFSVFTTVNSIGLLATTDDGGPINVASGIVEANLKSFDGNDLTAAAFNTVTGTLKADVNTANGATLPMYTDEFFSDVAASGEPNNSSFAQDIADIKGHLDARLDAVCSLIMTYAQAANEAATAAQTASEKLDTANELRTLLTGGTSAVSTLTAEDVNVVIEDASVSIGWQIATDVNDGTCTTTSFPIVGGPASAWFPSRLWTAVVVDADTSLPAVAPVTGYDETTGVITVGLELPFTPAENDIVYLIPSGARTGGGGWLP